MTEKSVFLIGNFGYTNEQLDGQTIKTRSMLELARGKYHKVDYYDTQSFSTDYKAFFKAIGSICKSDSILYLPAQNNLIYFFPFLFFLSCIFKFDINYFVVGGWLDECLKNKPIHRFFLRRIKAIYSETALLKNNLKQFYSFENVQVFPNFRKFVPRTDIGNGNGDVFKIVFFARIMKEKGIDVVFQLADYISDKGITNIIIDFYGQVISRDSDYFYQNLSKHPFTNYNGAIAPDKIYDVLSKYDVLLFPTHFYTEGLPGTIVDAYISGIPVIAVDWKYASEFVEDMKTGIIVPFENNLERIIDSISILKNNLELLSSMKKNALIKSKQFSYENASQLFELLHI